MHSSYCACWLLLLWPYLVCKRLDCFYAAAQRGFARAICKHASCGVHLDSSRHSTPVAGAVAAQVTLRDVSA